VSAPTNVVDRIPLLDAVRTRLTDQLPVTTPATKGYLTEATDVPLLPGSQIVQRYWVLHPWPGNPDVERDLADNGIALDWGFQLTVAAGYSRDVLDLLTRVEAALFRWTPVIDGYECGRLRPPPGFNPGPVQVDRDFTPHRYWLPLQYQTTISRAS
jgi:hypothetical protein